MDEEMRDYLQALHDLIDTVAGPNWQAMHAAASLETVLGDAPYELERETDYLRQRLAEVQRARQAKQESNAPPRQPEG